MYLRVALVLSSISSALVGALQFKNCADNGIEANVSGVVVELYTGKDERMVLVDSTKRIKIECSAKLPVILKTGFEEYEEHLNFSKADLKVGRILWKENETTYWSRRNVSCTTKNGSCSISLTRAAKLNNETTHCNVNATSMDCTVREWFTEVQKDRSSRSCPSTPSRTRSQQPTFQFAFFNPTTQNWTECGKGRAGAGKSFENISNILCDVQGFKPKKSDNLILRLRKMFMSTKILRLGEVDCQDETYLSITGDYFELSLNNSLSYGSTAAIIVVSTGFLFLLIFCCLKQLKLRRNLGSETSPGKSATLLNHQDRETSFTPLSIRDDILAENGELVNQDISSPDNPGENVDISSPRVDTLLQDVNEEKNIFELMSRNLDGNLCRFNPDLTLNAQTQVLEYKRNIFEISRERFDPGMIIGQGQFGTVGLGTLITDSGRREKVAVKQAKNHGDRSQWLSIIDELKILSQLERNYSLVNLVGANTLDFQSMGKLYLLLEYCPHGDMKTFLGKNRRNFSLSPTTTPGRVENEFNMSLLFTWSYSIAHGMNYLASKKIMHGDLAARNILIGAGYEAKISDFGLSKMMYYNEDYKKTERKMIPWAWMALEYLKNGDFNLKSDVWSFGVTLWEMFTLGEIPYSSMDYETAKVKIVGGMRLGCPEILRENNQLFYDKVMHPCWEGEGGNRPTFSKLESILGEYLGEQGIQKFKDEEQKYLTNSSPKPNKGYSRVESIDGSRGTASFRKSTSPTQPTQPSNLPSTSPTQPTQPSNIPYTSPTQPTQPSNQSVPNPTSDPHPSPSPNPTFPFPQSTQPLSPSSSGQYIAVDQVGLLLATPREPETSTPSYSQRT